MIASSFNNGARTAIADPEAFTGAAVGKQLTASGAIEAGVAQDHLAAGIIAAAGGHHGETSTAKAFADVVVGLTHQAHIHALHVEGTEALTGKPFKREVELTLEPGVAMAFSDLAGQAGADAAIGVDDRHGARQLTMALDGRHQFGIGEELIFKNRPIAVGLTGVLQPGAVFSASNRSQQAGQIQGLGLGQLHLTSLKQLRAADQLLQAGDPQHAEQLAHLFSDIEEEVDHLLRQTGETLAQVFLLRCHAHRAVIGVANAGHDAALSNHRDRAEAVLLSAQQSSNHHIPTGLEAAIGAQQHAIAQTVFQQGAVHLGQTHFPGAAGVLDRAQWRGARTAVMA